MSKPIPQLNDAALVLNALGGLVPADRRKEFWQHLAVFCSGAAGLPDKLDQLEKLVANLEHPGDWPDDIYGMCGGNYDDAFMQGVNHGEGVLAKQVQEILDA